jgi:dual specificity protein kinase YAK1
MKDFKTYLTKPSERAQNAGLDNANGDYIFRVGDLISETNTSGPCTSKTYLVESLLGHGTFGQVLKCLDVESRATYAIKVIKNLPAYNRQAQIEKHILKMVSIPRFSSHSSPFLHFSLFLHRFEIKIQLALTILSTWRKLLNFTSTHALSQKCWEKICSPF